ncbi:type 1 fimbrial protein [Salmonella enterica]|nr:type 1 fimbrial protein [Salmonella enterica]ECX8200058.1 type 1 fimbrial protein [Salmonella enterica]ELE6319731.1 type 1 fimbrial protein [Salmonella enterica]
MLKKNIIISALTVVALTATVHANQGSGKVNFKGTVVNAACGIDPDSVEQTIDFGQLSMAHLNDGNTSNPVPFSIKLVNCDTTTLNEVQIAFAGATTADKEQLGTAGVTNTAIKVSNQDGSLVSFDGTPNKLQTLIDGNNTLHFSSWVEAASGGTGATPPNPPKTVAEGQFTAVANFNLTYQ